MESQPKVKRVEKRVKFTNLEDMIRLQLLLYSFTNHIHLTPGDYNLLVHIAIYGYDRVETLRELVDKKLFKHKQSVRNTKNKLLDQKILVEHGRNKCYLNPTLQIESHGHIMIDFKAINI